eukprot:g8926.t3
MILVLLPAEAAGTAAECAWVHAGGSSSSKRCPVRHPHQLEGPNLATTAPPRGSPLARGSNDGELDNRKRTRGKTGRLEGQETPVPAPATTGSNRIASSSTRTTTTTVAGSRSYRSSSSKSNNNNNTSSSDKLSRPKAYRSLAPGPPEPSEKDQEVTTKAAHHDHSLETDYLPSRVRRRMPGATPLARVRTSEATTRHNTPATHDTTTTTTTSGTPRWALQSREAPISIVSVERSVPAAALAVGSSGVAAGAAPEGEAAALRARLAEAEAKNAEALARVRELEENNFDLEAAIQMVEVEASHRVEKQAKALQSELNFKAHQLTVAQKDHTSAVRELNAERAKRKRDSQQAARERQDAVAKAAAAAAATAAAGAAEAAAAEAAAAAAAAAQDASLRSSNGKERKQQSSIDWRRHQQQLEGDKRAVLLPPPLLSPTTLAEAILSESSEDVMVLLSAGGSAGAAAASRHLSAAADDEWAEEGGNDSSESDGDHNNGYWDASPRRRRGSDGDIGGDRSQESGGTFSPLSGAAPDSTSPVRLAPWEHRLRAEETPTTVRGASFSRPQFRHAGGAGFSAGRHADTGYVKGGSQSPQCLWGAEGEEGRGEGEREGEDFDSDADDDDGDAKSDETLEQELRRLSSQMFSCALGLLEGQACAGDLLDVLVGFLEAVPGETEYELDVLVSAVRLVYRALAVTPPAALAVALADAECDNNHDHDTASATANPLVNAGHGGGGASIPVDRKLGLDEEEPPVAVESAAATGKGKGKGRKRARSEISVTDTSRAEERGVNVDDLDEGGDAGDKQSQRHRFRGGADSGSCEGGAAAEPCPSPSLFVAGQLVTAKAAGVDTGADAEDGKSRASASVFAPSSAYRRRGRRRLSNPPTAMTSMSAVGADRGTHRGGEPQTGSGWPETWEVGGARADVGWTGTREDTDARELCRRVKGRLVGLFHRGAMYGCSTLVEVCLQTILSAVWDRNGDELLPWGGLVSLGSLNHVMSSELFRPAWELGAEVVRVLLRNAELFQAIARAGAVEGEAGQEESPLEQQQAALEAAGEAAVSGKSHTARALSLPTPGGSGGVQDGLGGDAKLEDDGAEDNGGDFRDSLLRRLCLGAVAIGEHAPFGENIGLRLSIIRLLLSACQTYGVEAARPLFGGDGLHGGSGGDGDGNGNGGRSSSVGRRAEVGGGEWEDEEIIPALVNFVHLELEDWERRRYSEANPVESDRSLLLKEGFQLLWAIAMHSPLSLRDMVRGAGMYNTLVSVVSRFYNSLEMEKFQEEEQLQKKEEQLREEKLLLLKKPPAAEVFLAVSKLLADFGAVLTRAVVTDNTLELVDGTFFLGESELRSKLFIRPCYEYLSELVLEGRDVLGARGRGHGEVVSPRCTHAECTTRTSNGHESDGKAEMCSEHAGEGMVDLNHKLCQHPECTTQASYGHEADGEALTCSERAGEGMVNVVSPRYTHPESTTQPTYGYLDDGDASTCAAHKDDLDGTLKLVVSYQQRCTKAGDDLRPNYDIIEKMINTLELMGFKNMVIGGERLPLYNMSDDAKKKLDETVASIRAAKLARMSRAADSLQGFNCYVKSVWGTVKVS